MSIDNLAFKKIIVIFWTIWWLIALWTDVVGGLAHLGVLHATWAPDTNYPFLAETLKMYQVPSWVVAISFIGIIAWSLIATVAFALASLRLNQPESVWFPLARTAFFISILFWMAFFLADQLVMKFDLEQNHMVQGGFELLSFLVFSILPNHN